MSETKQQNMSQGEIQNDEITLDKYQFYPLST